MENRLSMVVREKQQYTEQCVEITAIVEQNMEARKSMFLTRANGHPISDEDFATILGTTEVRATDVFEIRRAN